MSAPQYRSHSTATDTDTSLTITKPTGVTSGDLLIAITGGVRGSGVITFSPAVGGQWDLIQQLVGSNTSCFLWGRTAGGSEPSSYTFNGDNTPSQGIHGAIIRFDGQDNPYLDTSTIRDNRTTHEIFTTRKNALIVAGLFQRHRNAIITVPSPLTQRINIGWPVGVDPNGASLAVGDVAQVGVGSAGTFFFSNVNNNAPISFAFAIHSNAINGQDSVIEHVAETPALAHVFPLPSVDVSHGHEAETPALQEVHLLGASEASHGHVLDVAALQQVHLLPGTDATHSHEADAAALQQVHLLTAEDVHHDHEIDTPALQQVHLLPAIDSYHEHFVDESALQQVHLLSADNIHHSHFAGSANLQQVHVLTAEDCVHLHFADVAAITDPSDGSNRAFLNYYRLL